MGEEERDTAVEAAVGLNTTSRGAHTYVEIIRA